MIRFMVRKFMTADAIPDPTAREIAGAIPLPSALVGAESRLLGLRERADQLADELKWLRASCNAAIIDGPPVRAIRATDAIAHGVDREIVAARQKVDAARGGYIRQVRQALEPMRAKAEGGAREAITKLLRNWATLDEIAFEMRRVRSPGAARDRVTAEKFRVLIYEFIKSGIGREFADAIVKTSCDRLARSATVTSQDTGLDEIERAAACDRARSKTHRRGINPPSRREVAKATAAGPHIPGN